MSILININEIMRPPKRAIKPQSERKAVPMTEQVSKAPTKDEIIYSKMLEENPNVANLVERLGLVSEETGRPIQSIKKTDTNTDRDKLMKLALSLLDKENSYSKDEIVKKIQLSKSVSHERAVNGFLMMVDAEILQIIKSADRYYLKGSTPF